MSAPVQLVGGPYCGESYTPTDGQPPPSVLLGYHHGDHTRGYRYELTTYTLGCQIHSPGAACPSGLPADVWRYELAAEEPSRL